MDYKKCMELVRSSFDEDFNDQQTLDDCLATHPDCLKEYQQMQQAMQAMQTLPALKLPVGFRSKWRQSLKEAQSRDRWSKRRKHMVQWALAVAAVAFMVSITPSLIQLGQEKTADEAAMPSDEEVGAFNQASHNQDNMSAYNEIDEESISRSRMALDFDAEMDADYMPVTMTLDSGHREAIVSYLEDQAIDNERMYLETLNGSVNLSLDEVAYQELLEYLRVKSWLIEAADWQVTDEDMMQVELIFQ